MVTRREPDDPTNPTEMNDVNETSVSNAPNAAEAAEAAARIAADFADRWERAWNTGDPAAAARLYTADALLVGAAIAEGQPAIAKGLAMLYEQGWTQIRITVAHARSVGDVVLVASTFIATGASSSAQAGKTLNGRSSHVLTRVDDVWLSAMHSAA